MRLRVQVPVAGRVVGIARLGRAFLDQHRGQDDIGRHLQELALPILEHGRDEFGIERIGRQRQSRPAVPGQLLVLDHPARDPLADYAGQEEQHQGDREAVVFEQLGHGVPPFSRASMPRFRACSGAGKGGPRNREIASRSMVAMRAFARRSVTWEAQGRRKRHGGGTGRFACGFAAMTERVA
jgi:hypothetical protein